MFTVLFLKFFILELLSLLSLLPETPITHRKFATLIEKEEGGWDRPPSFSSGNLVMRKKLAHVY